MSYHPRRSSTQFLTRSTMAMTPSLQFFLETTSKDGMTRKQVQLYRVKCTVGRGVKLRHFSEENLAIRRVANGIGLSFKQLEILMDTCWAERTTHVHLDIRTVHLLIGASHAHAFHCQPQNRSPSAVSGSEDQLKKKTKVNKFSMVASQNVSTLTRKA